MTQIASRQNRADSIAAFTGSIEVDDSGDAEDASVLTTAARLSSYRLRSRVPRAIARGFQIEPPSDAPRLATDAVKRLNELLSLPSNWDTYGARRVSITAVLAAMSWLKFIGDLRLPSPSIVPVSDGSIQLEWHVHGIDLEVLFPPFGDIEYSFEDARHCLSTDGVLSSSNNRGREFVVKLASRAAR